jgi:hypothetical protein
MKITLSFFFSFLFFAEIKAQNDSLNRLVTYCFNELPVHDSLERIIHIIKSDTATFLNHDSANNDYYTEYRNYTILGKKLDASLFIITPDSEVTYTITPMVFVGVDFGWEAECDHYFNLALNQFSKYLIMKKMKPEKRPMLGNVVTYNFYDRNNKLILSLEKCWPFDLFNEYSIILSFYK